MGVALLSKCGIASLGVGKCHMALAGDEWPQWVWNCFIGRVYHS